MLSLTGACTWFRLLNFDLMSPPVPGLHPRCFVPRSPHVSQAPFGGNKSCLAFQWPWQLRGALVRCFIDCPSVWSCLMLFSWGYRLRGRPQGEHAILISLGQQSLLWANSCPRSPWSPGYKFTLFPLQTRPFERKSLCTAHTYGAWSSAPCSEGQHPIGDMEYFCIRKLSSPHLSSYFYLCLLIDSDFLFGVLLPNQVVYSAALIIQSSVIGSSFSWPLCLCIS
jgi:hypothetical protein